LPKASARLVCWIFTFLQLSFPSLFFSCSFFRRASSIQTDKNAEAALAAAIGDWSSGIIWAFVRSFKGPLH